MVNGRWLVRPLTGTGRYSTQALAAMLPLVPADEIELRVPKSGRVPTGFDAVRVTRSRFDGQLFEQIALPWAARRSMLINMSGPAPLLGLRQLVVMHDATPFAFPDAFSARFARWYRFMYWWLARRSTRLVTVSRFSAEELSRSLDVPAGRFRIAAPAASIHDVEVRRPEADLPERFVLMVGTLARNKNLVPAIRAVTSRGIPVVVAGARGATKVFSAESRLPEQQVHLLGRVDDAELAWLYDHADLLVFPSLYEGFGLPVLEAQSRGLPVVASRTASLPEVCADSVEYIDPLDEHDIGDVVQRLWRDDDRRRDLSESGLRNQRRFDWHRAAGEIICAADA